MNVPTATEIVAYVNPLPHAIPYIENWLDQIKKLARLKDVQLAKSFPASYAMENIIQAHVGDAEIWLDIEGAVDLGKERARLKKESEAVRGELDKIAVKLGNPQFIAKAKPEAIDEQREREAQGRAALARLDAALARLGGA
jgi:valyl-tRNA synthetase